MIERAVAGPLWAVMCCLAAYWVTYFAARGFFAARVDYIKKVMHSITKATPTSNTEGE